MFVPRSVRVHRLSQFLWLYVVLVACKVVYSQSDIICATIKEGSPCPDFCPTSWCKTLDWYSDNVDVSFTSNVTMVLLEGQHSLKTFVQVSQCHNFTMVGSTHLSWSSDGQPQPASWIKCNESHRSGLYFFNSSEIHFSKIGFDSCGGKVVLKHNLMVYVSLAVHMVFNLTLDKVVIENAKGFGMYCDNVFGRIHLNTSVFKNTSRNGMYGGNVRFWFGAPCFPSESNVIISDSWFIYGKETLYKYRYGAGGLQVMINCSRIRVLIDKVTAHGNTGVNGGNIALSLSDLGSDVSTITINNSNISNGWATKGAGVRFWSRIVRREADANNTNDIFFSISNTIFSNNAVNKTGGAMYIAHYEAENFQSQSPRQIKITNCTFVGNKGNGAAMEILKQTIPGYIPHVTPQLNVSIESCRFHNNVVPSHKHSSIIELIGTKSIQVSNSNFTNSSGSVFSLRNSNLNFFGTVHFENNHATYGGALKVCDSSMVYIHNGTTVLFVENRAQRGGAVYAQQGCLDTAPACVFQPAVSEEVPIEEFSDLMELRFVNNSASQAGDAIYGGSIDFCYTLKTFSFNGTKRFLNYRHIFRRIVNTEEQYGPSTISSDPRGVCFCDSIGIPHCKGNITATHYLSQFPGQMFQVSVSTVGQVNESTIGLINASFTHSLKNINTTLISINSTSVYQGCVSLSFRVHSNKTENVTIKFSAISSDVNTYYRTIHASLVVDLLSCPSGFHLDLLTGKCDCDSLLDTLRNLVTCDIDKQVIQTSAKSQIWIGYEMDPKNQSLIYLTRSTHCFLYCSSSTHNINISNKTSIDTQCLFGRTGVLCGECKPGLSRILGSTTKCEPCSNWNLIFLIPAFLMSGILLIFLLSALNFTVTEGTVSALVIYANIIYTYQGFNHIHGTHIYSMICWGFIALLNFDFGFDLCFYNGMDGYQQIWLRYGYVFYLTAIQVIVILLCRKFTSFTWLFGRNIVKVFATLLFLMYSPLMYAILQSFHFATLHASTLHGVNNAFRTVWHFDGNIPYFGAKHLPLFIVSVLCTSAMIWFTFSLLLIPCLQRRSNLLCFRWVDKLRPFFEAYTGPCRDNYRFWPGFLMLMRVGMYIMNTSISTFLLSPSQRKLVYVATAAICVIILSLSCAFPHGVYEKWPLNMLEFSFFLNLCITSAFWTSSDIDVGALVNISISIAMLTFLVILVYHIKVKLKSNICKRLDLNKNINKVVQKIPCKHTSRPCCFSNESSDDDELTPLLSQPLPCVVHFEQFREPLIDNIHH